jgi:hypothetical protein
LRRIDHAAIATELLLPEGVTKHDHEMLAGIVLFPTERAAENGSRVEHLEEPRADAGTPYPPSLAGAGQRQFTFRKARHAREGATSLGFYGFFQAHEIRRRQDVGDVPSAVIDCHKRDQPIGLIERQRPQKHRIDDAENRGRQSDTERERSNRDESKPRISKQHAHTISKVLSELFEHRPAPGRGRVFRDQRDTA